MKNIGDASMQFKKRKKPHLNKSSEINKMYHTLHGAKSKARKFDFLKQSINKFNSVCFSNQFLYKY